MQRRKNVAKVKRVAVVTGGNRGIGFEICRQLAKRGMQVILTARDPRKGRAAAKRLADEGLDVTFHRLDVTDESGVRRLANHLKRKVGRLDVLVNNAGIYLEGGYGDGREPETFFEEGMDEVRATVETNLYGPYMLCQALVPLMQEGGYGRVVNVSSGSGQLSRPRPREAGYRISKAGLNALTVTLAAELPDGKILVNCMCPGWVRSDMGGPEAPRSLAEGADTATWLATLPKGGPHGLFFRDRKRIPW
jgi:NAD(P)-dependent dehydrogenase (short-subunit alcohol dehydrogenase family)